MIPAALFVAWVQTSGRLLAADQYRATLAVQLGGALVMDPKQPPVKRAMRELRRIAEGRD